MTASDESQQRLRPSSPRWVNTTRAHDLRLTAEYLNDAPAGTVLSVLGQFGSGRRVPIAFAKRDDGTWVVHARGRVTSDRLVGGLATPRRRAGAASVADTAQEPLRPPTPERRVAFAEAVARMAGIGR